MTPTSRRWVRIAFAGPGAVLIALVVMAGMTLWLPAGKAGIDNLVLPLVLAPLIWAGLFFHACLDRRLGRVAIVAMVLLLVHSGLIANRFREKISTPAEAHR
ncbi:hypothetical protein J3E64_001105 [Sphingobium sp. OAS761]|uniref:hypothetical protein n=1 Tax=Sphingobium sp. OAS761 TaxID=2817901 RepID=UPI0020A215B0|nr:hypothetical protein [Sphingobium sp. OAS761]MCP1469430.1 hypothetical protein [Sphingobium sp. OAS761]